MRERVALHGAAGLADYEILEMLLFLGVPRRDTKPQAKALINSFGSLSAVLEATPQALKAAGVGPVSVALLTLMPDIAQTLAAPQNKERHDIGTWSQLLDYCHAAFAKHPAGQMRVLFLDIRNGLLADEALTDAVLDPAEVEPQVGAVLRRALEQNASGLITVSLVSQSVTCARTMQQASPFVQALLKAAPLFALEMCDHVCLKNKEWLSFRSSGYAE